MKNFVLLIILIMTATYARAESYNIAFYNVENMFDHIDDPNIDDSEFTPNGSQSWTEKKALDKIVNIAKVIYKMRNAQGQMADVIGLAEVENERVLKILTSIKEIKELGYEYVHYDSPDKRGIDVAFLYRKSRFQVTSSSVHTVSLPTGKPTRDILQVNGVLGGEEFTFFVNHWPSRSGGEAGSIPFRKAAAETLKSKFEILKRSTPNSKVVVMGDFNDNPKDKSLKDSLGAKLKVKDVVSGDLFNPYYDFSRRGEGSNVYQDVWFSFDQIIVSDLLLNGSGLKFAGANVYRPNYLIQSSGQYRGYPMRSQVGGTIGYSDHLPVFITVSR